MKKLLAVIVMISFVLSVAAFAKQAPKAAVTCDVKCAVPADAKAAPMLFANAKEKKEFAKQCKYMCEKCSFYAKKGGDCTTCNVTMKKCTNVDECKKMVECSKMKSCCMKCGTYAAEAGKCPKCGKNMKKVTAKNMEACKKACGLN